jgi:maleate isomerase
MRRRDFVVSAGLGAIGASIAQPRSAAAQDPSWEYDGAGTIARFGVITPDFDPVPESEMWAMVPRGISIHAARVARSGPPARFVEPPHIDDAVDRLVALAPRAILLGYTSSSYALGAEADSLARSRLEQRAKGIPVIFTCQAATTALRHLNVRRISIVHPPWWNNVSNDEGMRYWRDAGFDVVRCTRLEPLRSFTEVAAAEVFKYVNAVTPRSAEAVFIGGNGLRVVGLIRALESRLSRPVLSANQVVLWEGLRTVEDAEAITRYGSIFSKPRAGG